MDIASIASFLLPTLLSLLSGEGHQNNQEKFSHHQKSYRYARTKFTPK
jgi:hypothetical protein